MHANDGTDNIKSLFRVVHPVPNGLAGSVLERSGTGGDRPDLGAEQLHSCYIGSLTPDILFTHIDNAVKIEQCAYRSCCNSMLTGTGFGYDPFFAHPPGEKRLPQGVVDLVGSGVAEIFAFQVDCCALNCPAQPFGMIEGSRASYVVSKQVFKCRVKRRIVVGFPIFRFKI